MPASQMSLAKEDDISVILRYESHQFRSLRDYPMGIPRNDPKTPSHSKEEEERG